jgi:RpiR family glv operon transcriptional regulator
MTSLKNIASRHFTNFTESDRQIYEVLTSQPTNIQKLTIKNLAKLSYTSKSSVLRFVQKLGFQGFSDFKYSIDWLPNQPREENLQHPLTKELLVIEKTLAEEKLHMAKKLLKSTTLICLIATGEDQVIQMKNFARFLLKKGIVTSQLKLNPNAEITKLVLDKLTPEHLLIVFTSSGNNRLIKSYLLPLLEKKVPIIAITAFKKNWLEEVADLTFSLQISPKNSQLIPYTSGLSHLLINMLIERMALDFPEKVNFKIK